MDDERLDFWFHRSSSYFLSAWKCFETVSDASEVGWRKIPGPRWKPCSWVIRAICLGSYCFGFYAWSFSFSEENIKISTNLFRSSFYEPKAEISKLWPMGQIQPVVVNKLLLEHSHHVYLYYLWLPLSYYSWNSDLTAKPKIFPIWLFVEKVFQPLCPPHPNLKHS